MNKSLEQERERLTNHMAYIMDRFDFNRVAMVMSMLGWKWVQEGKPDADVPNLGQIKASAADLMNYIIKDYEGVAIGVGSGGFYASIWIDLESRRPVLDLKFELEQLDSLMADYWDSQKKKF